MSIWRMRVTPPALVLVLVYPYTYLLCILRHMYSVIRMSRPVVGSSKLCESVHRSSQKEYSRLLFDVPDVFKSVSVLQRDVRARQVSKTFAKLLA